MYEGISACMAPTISHQGLVDEFGFPLDTQPQAAISPEDLQLVKYLLGSLKEQTLSRSMDRLLSDLLERLA